MPPYPIWGWTIRVRAGLWWLATLGTVLLMAGTLAPTAPTGEAPILVVDPNTARPDVLDALPRLGPVLVGRIVAARVERPFQSLDDFDQRVKGIGPATIRKLRPHLKIAPPSTLTDAAPLPLVRL